MRVRFITLYISSKVKTCNLTSHDPSLKLRLPSKISLSCFVICKLFFVKIALQFSLQNYSIESKASLDNLGKTYDFFPCGDKILTKGNNSLCVV